MHKCPHCCYVSGYKYNFERHLLTKHKEQQLQCSECNFITYDESELKEHTRKSHKLFECKFCGEEFTSRQTCWRHVKSCGLNLPDLPPPPINYNITKNIQNITIFAGSDAIAAAAAAAYMRGSNIVPMIFPYELDPEEPPDFKLDHMIDAKRRYSGVRDAVQHLHENPYNMPMRKQDIKSGFSEIHIGDNKWVLHPDTDVAPRLLYHSVGCLKGAPFMKYYTILTDRCDSIRNMIELVLEAPEYRDEKDNRVIKTCSKEFNDYMKTIKLLAYWNHAK